MPERTCSIDGCCKAVTARALCSIHYHAWRKATCSPCSVGGCDKPGTSSGMCPMHYSRWSKHGDPLVVKHRHDNNRVDRSQRKQCQQCGAEFGPTPRRSHAQWQAQQFCPGRSCASAWKAQQQTKAPSTTRREGERWARWWERQRRAEDRADIKAWKRKRGPQCRITAKPTPRAFIAGYCLGCEEPWVDYAARRPSGYCKRCQDRRWAADSRHKRRAWKVAANVVEVISPDVVFKRDHYRCQLCGAKTKGKHPHPRSPTIDHIIPLALGGDHSYLNVQCACFACNTSKGASAANDQLRLVA